MLLTAFCRETTQKFYVSNQTLRIMRLTGILLLTCGLTVSARTVSQTITLSAKNTPLHKVFVEIQQQTGYSVFYNYQLIQKARPVSINAVDEPLKEFMEKLLQDQALEYAIRSKTIIIKLKTSNTDEPRITTILGNPPPITGRITDGQGRPIPNATIAVRGSDKGSATDADGFFSIDIKTGDVIIISSIGYESREIRINQLKSLNVELQLKPESLDTAAVISNGFQKLEKNKLIGSYSFVNNELLNKRITKDVISRLEGNVPGLLFNKNTVKNAYGQLDINIQGRNTFYADDQPLIVVDNFAYSGSLNSINPNDVESISVLKDASAAALWGVRSGNGVIVITTKKGKRNSPLSVETNTNVTVTDKPNLFYNTGYMNSADYISLEKRLFDSGAYYLGDPSMALSPVVQILADKQFGRITESEANNMLKELEKQDVRNDINRYLYRRAVSQQYSVSLRGGSENNDYIVGLGFDNVLTGAVGNKEQRATLNSQFNFYLSRKLSFNTGINIVYSLDRNNASAGVVFPSEPYLRLADDNGNALEVNNDYSPRFKDSLVATLGLLDWKYKPLDEIKNADQSLLGLDNRINLGVKYKIIDGLNMDVVYQYQRNNYDTRDYASINTYPARNTINRYTYVNSDGSLTYAVPMGGILNNSTRSLSRHDFRTQLSYNFHWKEHNVNGVVGSDIRSGTSRYSSEIVYGYNQETETNSQIIDFATYFPTLPFGAGSRIINNQGFGKNKDNYLSYYGDVIYSYKNVFGASLTGRVEHSNLFGVKTNQKAKPLYSVGVSYTMSNAEYYKSKWLTLSKIRFTFGYNGNVFSNATAVPTARQDDNAPYTGLDHARIQNPGNPELRWEQVRKIMIGYDFAIKNNVVSGNIDFYFKKGIDLFGNFILAPSSGFTQFFGNYAGSKGHGFDLSLTSNNIRGRNFQWSSIFSLSHIIDKVLKSEADPGLNALTVLNYGDGIMGGIVPLVGKPLFGAYSYRSAGLSHETGDPQGYLQGKLSTNYTAILQETTVDSLVLHGSATPTFFGNFRNNISFKGLSLSFNFIYKLNYYVRKSSMSDAYERHSDYNKRWQKPGDETNTYVPSILFPPHIDGNRSQFYRYSAALIDRGDHIRLQDINLSYTIQKKQKPSAVINVYAAVANLGVIWRANSSKIDPDLFAASTRLFPLPKAYTVGAKITL